MPWITQIRVGENKTSFTAKGNAKAEREFVISFSPGELSTTDTKSITTYCREMGQLVKLAVDEALGFTNEVREPAPRIAPDAKASPPKEDKYIPDEHSHPQEPTKEPEKKPTKKAAPEEPAKEEKTKTQGTLDAPESLPGEADEEPPLKDRKGTVWPRELTCKECGSVCKVKPNKNKEPYAICAGSEDNPHGPYFLKHDGSLGNPAQRK